MVEAMDEPLRRVVLYAHLLSMHFFPAEWDFERSLYACRNNPDIETLLLPRRFLLRAGFRPASANWVNPDEFLTKAEQCSVDTVRAFYISSIDRAFDKPKMARMLAGSGRKALLAICHQLERGESEWRISSLAPEEQERQLDAYVAHWKQVYGIN
jgi:hypothetical protein